MRNMPKLYQIPVARFSGSTGHYNDGGAKTH